MAAELRLSRSLYSESALDRSCAAFASLATVTVRRDPDAFCVTISAPHPAYGDRLVDEFANHVLAGTIRERRVS